GSAAFPEVTGLIASFARPGGNVTGIAYVGPEYGKRLELLREMSPRLSRVALLYNDANPASVIAVRETQQWADKLKVTLEPHGGHDAGSPAGALAAVARKPPGALMTTADRLVLSYQARIVEFATRYRLLSMYPQQDFVALGGLASYGSSTTEMYG